MGLIILEASDDYCFVETGDDGEVEHYRPSLICAEKQHMVTVTIWTDLDWIRSLLVSFINVFLDIAGVLNR